MPPALMPQGSWRRTASKRAPERPPADATGNGHAGAVSGASWTTAGRNGNALSFDGVNDWVTVADANDLDLTTGMTIEAWVYPTTANSAWRTVLAKELGGDLAYAMQANSTAGRPYGLITTSGEQLAQGSAPIPANAWSHMTTTYDGTTLRLYVNGALVGTKATSGPIATTNLPLHIGGNAGHGEWFQGRLDDIRIYNRPLTAAEIQTDMNTAVGRRPRPPPAAAGSRPRSEAGLRRRTCRWWPCTPPSCPTGEYRCGRVRSRSQAPRWCGIPRRRRSNRLPPQEISSAW